LIEGKYRLLLNRVRIRIRIGAAFLQYLDPNRIRILIQIQSFLQLFCEKHKFLKIIESWIRIRKYFKTLDPDPHVMDADPKPSF